MRPSNVNSFEEQLKVPIRAWYVYQSTRSGDSARQHGQQLGTTANQRGNSAANQGDETQPAQHGGEPEGSNLMDCPSDGMGGTTDGEDSQRTRSGSHETCLHTRTYRGQLPRRLGGWTRLGGVGQKRE
jgi:hypothetical protein